MSFTTFLRRPTLAALMFALVGSLPLAAQNVDAAAKAKLDAATAELAKLRERIATERVPMAAELRSLENEVIDLRRERERRQRLVDNQSVDLANLESQAKAFEDESTYVINLLGDFINRANSALAVAEVPSYGPIYLEVLNGSDASGLTAVERINIQLKGLQTSFDYTADAIGGHRFEGSAVLSSGQLAPGKFAQIGPVGYFAADTGPAGLIARGAGEKPALVEFDPQASPAIKSFISSGEGELAMDPTLGRALAIATSKESLLEHFSKGGLWMWPIAFFGILAIVISAFKLLDILSIKPFPKDGLSKVFGILNEKGPAEAIQYINTLSGPGADMVRKGLENITLPTDLIEEFLFESILAVKPKLERGIAFITLAASVAPLLGLLGTVTGMIETFKLLTLFGTGDAKSLSSGISQALITTEFGLVVAIPALILAAIISRNITAKLAQLDTLMVSYANGLAAHKATS